MFRIDRIREAVMAPRPKSPDFERPADFDVKAYAQRSPWTFTSDPPEEVQLAFAPEAAEVGNEDFGPTAVKRTDHDRIGGEGRTGEAGSRGDSRNRQNTVTSGDPPIQHDLPPRAFLLSPAGVALAHRQC